MSMLPGSAVLFRGYTVLLGINVKALEATASVSW